MAGKTTESLTLFSQKKLLGKAHTSNLKLDGNETIPSFIAQSNAQVFGEPIPTNPNKVIGQAQGVGSNPGCVEFVVFELFSVDGSSYDANSPGGGAGSDTGESGQTSGPHAYAFKLTDSYEADSSNPKKGTGFFKNGQHLSGTLGGLQIVPSSFSLESDNPYIIELYKNQPFNLANTIGIDSDIDWQLDTTNGILFVQDFTSAEIPRFARGFIYTGEFSDKGKFYSGVSGSLTRLTDGSSYLVAGTNVTISSASNGQVTINASGGGASGTVAGSDTQVQFNDNGAFGASSAFTFTGTEIKLHATKPKIQLQRALNGQDSDIEFLGAAGHVGARLRFSGSASNDLVFSTFTSSTLKERLRIRSNTTDVAIEATGSLKVTQGISGSLTQLDDGSSYLISGNSISITSQSNGSVLISAPNFVFNELMSGVANGTNTKFTLSKTPTANKNVSVFVNGQLQTPATDITGAPFQDYSVTGSVVFFTTASMPPEGSIMMANYTTNDIIT